jgi:hypothetical protein
MMDDTGKTTHRGGGLPIGETAETLYFVAYFDPTGVLLAGLYARSRLCGVDRPKER